jgi:hypothetical protein
MSMTPTITSIPPDIVLLNKIERLKMMMTDLKFDLKQSFKSETNNLKDDFKGTLIHELDDHAISGSGF